jgi:glycosyltransferase involved in cell wall biosynthesis
MGKITFSIVTTVLNEQESICPLLDTLINQSLPPGEIIIIDAGSNDQTVDLIKKKSEASEVPIRCLYCPGLNRSEARNEGIRQAVYAYIAVTDAGCEADSEWLMLLSEKFEDGVEAAGGFYLPKVDQPIQEVFSRFTCVSADDFEADTFLPSSRSIAFTKKIWKEVGGYPEDLETCEDLVYAKKLFDTGKMTTTSEAIVYWRQAESWGAYFKQIAGYARGDVQARYRPHLKRIASVWLRYTGFLLFPPLFLIYAVYVLFKFKTNVLQIEGASMTFLVQIVTDWAIMTGSLAGLLGRYRS